MTDTAADGHAGHVPSVGRQPELRCRCFGGAGPGTMATDRHTHRLGTVGIRRGVCDIHREHGSECVPLYTVQVMWSDSNPMMWRGRGEGLYWATDWADPNERGWASPPAFLSDAPPYGKLRMLWAPRLPDVFGVGCEPNKTRREPVDGDGEVEHHPWAWLRDQVRVCVIEQPHRGGSAAGAREAPSGRIQCVRGPSGSHTRVRKLVGR